ncbi:MAG: nucleoside deaminase [Planctomycetes bacterium]|nr:nucleoside deaminase [Planctomycetota bacterium]
MTSIEPSASPRRGRAEGRSRPLEALRRPGLALMCLTIVSLVQPGCVRRSDCAWAPARVSPVPDSASERDEIYSLAAMAVVVRDWQRGVGKETRGYNIGSVLVAPDGRIVAWGRNCNRRTANGTQHGEVRLIQSYLATARSYHLEGYSVYTTLEPCAQCSGMMVLAKLRRVVYAQTDPEFGGALERLALDSRGVPGGRGPYPRAVTSEHGRFAGAVELDAAYARELSRPDARSLVEWLGSDEARGTFERAVARLSTMSPQHPENRTILAEARAFVSAVPDHDVPQFPWDLPGPVK